jgi:putative transposase
MKRFKISEETSFYYSTCTIVAWLPVFQREPYFQIIINSLQYCQLNKGLFLLGYVIMPTHLHLITSNESDTTLSDIMRDFRTYTSRKIREQLESDGRINTIKIFKNSAKNLQKQDYRVWHEDYHPVGLKSEKWFNQKMRYMHHNPVRMGFVELPEHWKYSSARNWLLNDDSIIKIDKKCLVGEG